MFILCERLKGDQSFWKPFIDYLPEEIHTLYSYPDETPIYPGASETLRGTIGYAGDDLHGKIDYDRKLHHENKLRFMAFITTHRDKLKEMTELDIDSIDETLFDWAWMNVGTRCFGTYHLPCEIAMVPLLDLMNHSNDDEKLAYFLYPIALNIKMLERSDNTKINKELEMDYAVEEDADYVD